MTSRATRWFSLRRRLLVWLLGGVTLGWLAAVGVAYVETRQEIIELLEKRERQAKLEKRVRKELTDHLLKTMLTPLLFGVPLFGLWIWFATRRGLAPLERIAGEIAMRAPERLDPLVPHAAPREIRPLVEALNSLFDRVTRTLDNERRFTADAAHELRTPLAAITAQAQVAARARDAAEREHALAQLAASARRGSHLVDQLLTLARLDPAAEIPLGELRLDTLAAEACADYGAKAVEKSIALELDAPEPVRVVGNEAMLRVLLRNLIDNGVRYTPPGGQVAVGVTACVLTVNDSGPGIPVEQRAHALCRLRRLAGQEIEGSGLGLSIVARIAELHHARLELANGIGQPGLGVRLTFRARTARTRFAAGTGQ